jgi:Acetyltransferase (GNAT) family
LVAEEDGRLIGLLTYVVDGPRCEILTLHTDEPRRGVGSALIETVTRIAEIGDDGILLRDELELELDLPLTKTIFAGRRFPWSPRHCHAGLR